MATISTGKGKAAYVIPTVTSAPVEEIVVVFPSSPLPLNVVKALLSSLVSTFRVRPVSQLAAVEAALNLFCLAVPDLRTQLTRMQTVTVTPVTMTRDEMCLWLHVDDPEEGKVRPSRPLLLSEPDDRALAVTDTSAVYASVASVLFALGRQASESSRSASLDKRPDALIRRFDIQEQDQILLPGRASGPGREALEILYNAFANYTEVRSMVISYFMGVKRASSHHALPMEVMMTNFHLMRGAGMTHVDAILKLARMHPWTIKVAKLESYWMQFAKELDKFSQVEEDVRPYHRLLVGQGDYLFVSSEYRPLIAVAGDFIKDVEKTFSGYVYNAGAYAELIAEVRTYAPHYTNTTQLASLAQMLDIPDVPLPTVPKGTLTPASTIV